MSTQEAENDRALQISQFKAIAANREQLDEAQQPLMEELNSIKQRLRDYQASHNAITVRDSSCICRLALTDWSHRKESKMRLQHAFMRSTRNNTSRLNWNKKQVR